MNRVKYQREEGDFERVPFEVLEEAAHYKMLHPFLFESMTGLSILNNMFAIQLHQLGQWSAETFGDPVTKYRVNSKGFRGDEFPGQVDMITGGCSQTVGVGVHEDAVWHEVLAKSLNLSHVNIAGSGWSISQLVESIMWYIKTYGKPKKIVLLVPDLSRGLGVYNNEIFSDKDIRKNHEQSGSPVYVANYRINEAPKDYPVISKKPHEPKDVLPPEFNVYHSAQKLAGFIEYCRVGDIELVWGSWNNVIATLYEILDEIKKIASDPEVWEEVRLEARRQSELGLIDSSGLVDIDLSTWNFAHIEMLKSMSCHQDVKEKFPECFDVGTDEQKHYGAHAHAHVAEKFYRKIMEMSS